MKSQWSWIEMALLRLAVALFGGVLLVGLFGAVVLLVFGLGCGPDPGRPMEEDGSSSGEPPTEIVCALERTEAPCVDLLPWVLGPCGDLDWDNRHNCTAALHLLLGREISPVVGTAIQVAEDCVHDPDSRDCGDSSSACLRAEEQDASECVLWLDSDADPCTQLAGCFEAVAATGIQGVGGDSQILPRTICGELVPQAAGCP